MVESPVGFIVLLVWLYIVLSVSIRYVLIVPGPYIDTQDQVLSLHFSQVVSNAGLNIFTYTSHLPHPIKTQGSMTVSSVQNMPSFIANKLEVIVEST